MKYRHKQLGYTAERSKGFDCYFIIKGDTNPNMTTLQKEFIESSNDWRLVEDEEFIDRKLGLLLEEYNLSVKYLMTCHQKQSLAYSEKDLERDINNIKNNIKELFIEYFKNNKKLLK